jgi:hypothetical protein
MSDNSNHHAVNGHQETLGDLQTVRLICQPGRPVFEQGAPSSQAFYVEEGRLEVVMEEDGYEIRLAEIGPGEIFGEMGVLEEEARFASVRAIEKSVVLAIPKTEMEAKIAKIDDKIVTSLIEILISRLRSAGRGQLHYYKNLASFQNKMGGIMAKAGNGIDAHRRKEFSNEISPLLDQMDAILDKYKKP